MNAQQATEQRYEAMVAEMRNGQLWQHPESVPEAIAKHYCAHAIVALQLLKLCDMRRNMKYSLTITEQQLNDCDSAIKELTEIIKRGHLSDFGTTITSQSNPAN